MCFGKELDEARKQGEAYARELAQVFAHGEEVASPSTFPPPISASAPGERIATLARFAGGVAAELRGLLAQVGRDVQTVRTQSASRGTSDESEERVESIKRRMRQVQDIVSELARVGELDANEGVAELDLVDLVRSAARTLAPAVERGAVDLRIVTVPEGRYGGADACSRPDGGSRGRAPGPRAPRAGRRRDAARATSRGHDHERGRRRGQRPRSAFDGRRRGRRLAVLRAARVREPGARAEHVRSSEQHPALRLLGDYCLAGSASRARRRACRRPSRRSDFPARRARALMRRTRNAHPHRRRL